MSLNLIDYSAVNSGVMFVVIEYIGSTIGITTLVFLSDDKFVLSIYNLVECLVYSRPDIVDSCIFAF